MDSHAAVGHFPTLLCEDGHAHLCCLDGGNISLEQDRDGPGSRRILLGLLSNTDPGGTRQWQVSQWFSYLLYLTLPREHQMIQYVFDRKYVWGFLWKIRVGGERILFFSTASWAVITAATPLLRNLRHSVTAMTIGRFLMGLLQGQYWYNNVLS